MISTSFADIFFNNCFKNGILPIVVSNKSMYDILMEDAEKGENARMTVHLEDAGDHHVGWRRHRVRCRPVHRKHCLLNGLDDIGLTMEKDHHIDKFEDHAGRHRPWV